MTALTEFREHVAAVLAPALGVTIQPGRLEAPLERKLTACAWSVGTAEVDGQVDEQNLVVMLRVLLPLRQQRSTRATVIDPGPLEEVAEQIQVGWRAHLQEGGVWLSRVVSVDIDIDANMVEATFIATMQNLAIVA